MSGTTLTVNGGTKIIQFLRVRKARQMFLMAADATCVLVAYMLAFWLRFDAIPSSAAFSAYSGIFWKALPVLVAIRWLCGWLARLYNWSFSHASLVEAVNLALSVAGGTVLFYGVISWVGVFDARIPRSIYVLEACITLIGVAAVRFVPKYMYLLYCRYAPDMVFRDVSKHPTLIYGAGGNADILVRELLRTKDHHYRLVGLIDDDTAKRDMSLNGVKVLGPPSELPELIDRHGITEILVAIPDFAGEKLRSLIEVCSNHNVSYRIVPGYRNVYDSPGRFLQSMRNVRPEDLLDRMPAVFDHERLSRAFKGKTALVTGACGSIGSELCRQLADYGVGALVLLDMNENDGYFLLDDLRKRRPELSLSFEVGSIQDGDNLERVFRRHGPRLVFHAAAHKHVPLMESCPIEAIKNNVFGTRNVVDAAARHKAERFVLISTDKAVEPTNIMGATKQLAERLVCQGDTGGGFVAVRFGNVLGSSGSLLRIVERQIAAGGPVTVTHPKMTRFFMTIPEAVGLVLSAAILDEGRMYVLEMGKLVSIDKLVRQVISLSGFVPGKDMEIAYTSPRPGEKMYEELSSTREIIHPSSHNCIAVVELDNDENVGAMLDAAGRVVASGDDDSARAFIETYVRGYRPPAAPVVPS